MIGSVGRWPVRGAVRPTLGCWAGQGLSAQRQAPIPLQIGPLDWRFTQQPSRPRTPLSRTHFLPPPHRHASGRSRGDARNLLLEQLQSVPQGTAADGGAVCGCAAPLLPEGRDARHAPERGGNRTLVHTQAGGVEFDAKVYKGVLRPSPRRYLGVCRIACHSYHSPSSHHRRISAGAVGGSAADWGR